jgi:hypothetical protein
MSQGTPKHNACRVSVPSSNSSLCTGYIFIVVKRYAFISSSSLKPTAASHNGHRLIHNPFADPKISVNPGLYLFALADGGGFDTGWSGRLVSLDLCRPNSDAAGY